MVLIPRYLFQTLTIILISLSSSSHEAQYSNSLPGDDVNHPLDG